MEEPGKIGDLVNADGSINQLTEYQRRKVRLADRMVTNDCSSEILEYEIQKRSKLANLNSKVTEMGRRLDRITQRKVELQFDEVAIEPGSRRWVGRPKQLRRHSVATLSPTNIRKHRKSISLPANNLLPKLKHLSKSMSDVRNIDLDRENPAINVIDSVSLSTDTTTGKHLAPILPAIAIRPATDDGSNNRTPIFESHPDKIRSLEPLKNDPNLKEGEGFYTFTSVSPTREDQIITQNKKEINTPETIKAVGIIGDTERTRMPRNSKKHPEEGASDPKRYLGTLLPEIMEERRKRDGERQRILLLSKERENMKKVQTKIEEFLEKEEPVNSYVQTRTEKVRQRWRKIKTLMAFVSNAENAKVLTQDRRPSVHIHTDPSLVPNKGIHQWLGIRSKRDLRKLYEECRKLIDEGAEISLKIPTT